MPARPAGSAPFSCLADPCGSRTIAPAGVPAMRPHTLGLLVSLVSAVLVVSRAPAQERTITIDLDAPRGPTRLPPPPPLPPVQPPAPTPPAPQYYPTTSPPSRYCPRDNCADNI